MKDILLNENGCKINCDINGLKMTYTYEDDPKHHVVVTLQSLNSYERLKKELNDMYNSFTNYIDGCCAINDYIQSVECHEKYFVGEHYGYYDLRTRDEINDYLKESNDKVWFMRSRPCDIPDIEKKTNQWNKKSSKHIRRYPKRRVHRLGMRLLEWNYGGTTLGIR